MASPRHPERRGEKVLDQLRFVTVMSVLSTGNSRCNSRGTLVASRRLIGRDTRGTNRPTPAGFIAARLPRLHVTILFKFRETAVRLTDVANAGRGGRRPPRFATILPVSGSAAGAIGARGCCARPEERRDREDRPGAIGAGRIFPEMRFRRAGQRAREEAEQWLANGVVMDTLTHRGSLHCRRGPTGSTEVSLHRGMIITPRISVVQQ